MALLTRAGALDPVTGDLLDGSPDSPSSTVVSLFPRQHGGRGLDYHLRVFGLMRVSRGTARAFRSASVSRVIRHGQGGDVNERLKTQFLPPIEDLVDLLVDPPALLEYRVQAILRFLEQGLDGLPVQLDREAGS